MAFPTTPIIDNFNRANEDPLAGYTKVSGSGQLGIVSNQLVRTQAVAAYVVKDGLPVSPNQEAYFTIVTQGAADAISSVLLRATGDTFYRVGIAPGTPWKLVLERWDSGVDTPIGGSPVTVGTYNDGDQFGARINGSKIDAFLNGLVIGSVEDANIASGEQIGLQVSASPWVVDNFGGGNYQPEVFDASPSCLS